LAQAAAAAPRRESGWAGARPGGRRGRARDGAEQALAMPDLACSKAGGRVFMVSSLDPDHPAEGAIDSDDHTYWISTGLYPQEMLLELGRRGTVSSVRVVSTHVRRVRIEGCWEEQPLSFAVLAEQDIEDTGGRLQLRELRCGAPSEGPLSYVRVVVVSGWLDFCSLHKIEVEGEVADVGEAAAAPVAAPAPGGGGGPPGGDLGLGGRRWLNEWEATGGSELSAGACPHDEVEARRVPGPPAAPPSPPARAPTAARRGAGRRLELRALLPLREGSRSARRSGSASSGCSRSGGTAGGWRTRRPPSGPTGRWSSRRSRSTASRWRTRWRLSGRTGRW